jgi:hypothetical protein
VLICVVVELIPILIFWMIIVCINVRHDLAFGILVPIGTNDARVAILILSIFVLPVGIFF